MEQLKSDPKRTVIFPSRPELDTAQVTFKSMINSWQAKSPHNHELLAAVETEISKLRPNR